MGKKIVIVSFFWLVAVVSAQSFGPTIDSGREILSYNREGLIESPNPINLSGNQLITGNVAGGRHFRGDVDYLSPWEYGSQTSSSSLNSFLRRSADSAITDRYTGGYTPYYTPWSAYRSTSWGGSSGTSTKSAVERDARPAGVSESLYVSGQDSLNRLYATQGRVSEVTSTNMLQKLQQIQRDISYEAGEYPRDGQKLTDKQQRILEELKVDTQLIDDKASDLRYNKLVGENQLQSFRAEDMSQSSLEQIKPRAFDPDKSGEEQTQQIDIYDQMQEQLELLQQLEKLNTETEQTDTDYSNTDWQSTTQEDSVTESSRSKVSEAVSSAARAKSIMGENKDFASYLESKYREHIEEAENLLKQAEYYRAADAFTLASAYKSGAHLALAGRAHALFGAGEYMSSALFLSRALEIHPDYASLEIDIETMMGGRDVIETRLADVEKWAQESGTGELYFVMAYFYYRLDRIEKAKEAIDSASAILPEDPSVAVLARAIDEKRNSS